MSKVKVICVAFAAVLVLGAVTASGASAAMWFVGGALLPMESKVALANTAAVDSPTVLNEPAESVKITCTGSTLDGEGPLIISLDKGFANTLRFLGCSELSPANCTVTTAIETVPILALVTTGTGEEDLVTFSPEAGKTFVPIEFKGATCAVAGEKSVNGSVTIGAPTGQLELTLQAIVGLGSKENNSLTLAGHPAFLEGGKALLKLASGATWSFH